MRIAVPYDNGNIFLHFGHTENFKIYYLDDKKNIVFSEVMNCGLGGHDALVGFLKQNKVDALICGGIGGSAQALLMDAGILLFAGVGGNADDAVNALLAGTLEYGMESACSHHADGQGCGGCSHHADGHCCH